MFNPEFLATENNDPNDENDLIQYLQKQSPEVLQRVAKSASEDIQEIIRHNVQGLLGMLPSDQFDVKITSSKDNIRAPTTRVDTRLVGVKSENYNFNLTTN